MIADFTPIEETIVGQELLKKGREEGREEALAHIVRSMQKQGPSAVQIAKLTSVPLRKVRTILSGR